MTAPYDIRSLALSCGVLAIVLATGMYYLRYGKTAFPGSNWWAAAAACLGLGMLLISARANLPDSLSVIAANVSLMMSCVLFPVGLDRFNGIRCRMAVFGPCLVVVMALLFAYYTYVSPSVNQRVALASLVAAVLLATGIAFSALPLRRRFRRGGSAVLAAMAIAMGWCVIRAVYTECFERPIADFMSSGIIHQVSFLVVAAVSVLVVLGLNSVCAERRRAEASEAAAQENTLRGILPICSHCKQIRDDAGSWRQIELYIRENSEAEFSHGLCPACAAELYPEHFGGGGGR